MAKWIEYTGSDEQLEELKASYVKDGFIVKKKKKKTDGSVSGIIQGAFPIAEGFIEFNFNESWCVKEYLICDPHPNADLIKIWADTGCEVYIREHHNNYYDGVLESTDYYDLPPTDKPNWNIPGAEYRLTPFED